MTLVEMQTRKEPQRFDSVTDLQLLVEGDLVLMNGQEAVFTRRDSTESNMRYEFIYRANNEGIAGYHLSLEEIEITLGGNLKFDFLLTMRSSKIFRVSKDLALNYNQFNKLLVEAGL